LALQILKLDLRNDTVKLRVDDLDDLWVIYNTIEKGDLVLARTFRREKLDLQDSRPERGDKRPVYLGVRVEKVEFHRYVNALRLTGPIERGTDVGSYHTIHLEPGSTFSLVRKWRQAEIAHIREAVKEGRRPLILVIAMDEGDATMAVVRQRGVDLIGDITFNIPGKRVRGAKEPALRAFHSAVVDSIRESAGVRGIAQVLVVAPDLIRASFKAYADQHADSLAGISLHYDTCHSPGPTGVYEAIRRGAVDRIMSESRVSREIEAVEDFLRRIARDMPAAYGKAEVSRAVVAGAVELLLVTDDFFRSRRREADGLITDTERRSGEHILVSTDHEGGRKLQSLGGLGAVLRYRVD
jgi:protein pelota